MELGLNDWTIIHRAGAKRLNANAMSRRPLDAFCPTLVTVATQTSADFLTLQPGATLVQPLVTTMSTFLGYTLPYTTASLVQIHSDLEVGKHQQDDPDLAVVVTWLNNGVTLWAASPTLRKVWS